MAFVDRSELLVELHQVLEQPLWSLIGRLEETLTGFITVPHLNHDDPAAVGSAIHSALPSAVNDAGLAAVGLTCVTYDNGPSHKLTGVIASGGEDREISLELHLAGPQGGTRKGQHQFASIEADDAPTFEGFEHVAPKQVLLFLAYHLAPTKARVERLFLAFADGVDKKKIELQRPAAASTSSVSTADTERKPEPKGTVVKAKSRKGEDRDVGAPTKRGNGTFGSEEAS